MVVNDQPGCRLLAGIVKAKERGEKSKDLMSFAVSIECLKTKFVG